MTTHLRTALMVGAITMALALTACGGNSQPQETQVNRPSPTSTGAASSAATGASVADINESILNDEGKSAYVPSIPPPSNADWTGMFEGSMPDGRLVMEFQPGMRVLVHRFNTASLPTGDTTYRYQLDGENIRIPNSYNPPIILHRAGGNLEGTTGDMPVRFSPVQ